jgi:hypothetical protein
VVLHDESAGDAAGGAAMDDMKEDATIGKVA